MLLLGVNLLIPTIAFHFMDVASDDVVCELIEDFDEEEEDGETNKSLEDACVHHVWKDQIDYSIREQISYEAYPENNLHLRCIHLEVQTPPPQNTMS